MKRLIVQMVIPALFCGVMFISSCNKEESNSALSIYAFGQSTTKCTLYEVSKTGSQGLWCTGKDIKWYNGTTGELKLKNIPKSPYWSFFNLVIFLDDIELFSLETYNPVLSAGPTVPCISWDPGEGEWIYKGCKCGNKQDHIPGQNCEGIWEYKGDGGRYYISKYFVDWSEEVREEIASVLGQDYVDNIDRKREAFEMGWDKFIEQLKKEGKYRE